MTVYAEIFEDFKGGDIASFYETMYPELLVYVARILGDDYSFLAEDCVQDAVLKTWRRRDEFHSPLQWKVFLYTCIRNGAVDVLRKAHAHSNYIDARSGEGGGERNLMLDIIEQETLTLLYETIRQLPEELRQIFDMSFEQGLRNAEVARRLSLSEIAVKKRKARLINILRHRLRGKIDEPLLLLLLASYPGAL